MKKKAVVVDSTENGTVVNSLISFENTSGYMFLKRLIDVGLSATLLLISLPLMVVISLAIRLDSAGPVFFVQRRVGKDGRVFYMYKFRTMCRDAEEILPRLVQLTSLPEPAFKLKDDPRITRIGRFLRRSSLDEVPQLLNILIGEMSMVGPRPEEHQIVQLYSREQRERLKVKPGLTGPVQVSGRGDLCFEDRLRLEIEYIKEVSLKKDLLVMAKTIPAVLRGNGAR